MQLVNQALTVLQVLLAALASPDRLATEVVPVTAVLLGRVDSQDLRDHRDSKEQPEVLDSLDYRASEVTRAHPGTRVLQV